MLSRRWISILGC